MTTPKRYSVEQTGLDPRVRGQIQRPIAQLSRDLSGKVSLGEAQADAYAPAVSASWAGTAPTTIAEALDRCAALLKVLNGGTGP
jgi:hypothetical protein